MVWDRRALLRGAVATFRRPVANNQKVSFGFDPAGSVLCSPAQDPSEILVFDMAATGGSGDGSRDHIAPAATLSGPLVADACALDVHPFLPFLAVISGRRVVDPAEDMSFNALRFVQVPYAWR